jgi:ABC-2 type transport system permease protein
MSITLRVLRDHARAAGWWAFAFIAITLLYLGFYPLMGEEMMLAIEGMPAGLMAAMGYSDAGTPEGYTNAVIYRLLGPMLLLVYGLGLGARFIAGQEEDGTLELELAAPVARGRIYAERLLALWSLVAVQVLALTLAVLTVDPLIDLGLSPARVVAASFGLWLLVVAFASLAFAVGAASGRRGLALAVAAGVAVVAYLMQGIADGAGIEIFTTLSPFGWFVQADPLRNGFDFASSLKLVALLVVVVPLGSLRFRRRDLLV